MVLAFFDSKGMVYNNYVPKGQTVNKEYLRHQSAAGVSEKAEEEKARVGGWRVVSALG